MLLEQPKTKNKASVVLEANSRQCLPNEVVMTISNTNDSLKYNKIEMTDGSDSVQATGVLDNEYFIGLFFPKVKF